MAHQRGFLAVAGIVLVCGCSTIEMPQAKPVEPAPKLTPEQ